MGENAGSESWFRELYDAFNRRDIESVLAQMQPDVAWANWLEGGMVQGRDAVRQYWTRQFQTIQPQLEILRLESDVEGRTVLRVHQIVRDLEGNLLFEIEVGHRYTLEAGRIARFDILEDI